VHELAAKNDALAYLKERGVTKRPYQHGESAMLLKSGGRCTNISPRPVLPISSLSAHGLAKRPDREDGEVSKETPRLYDRFRGRIMFPILISQLGSSAFQAVSLKTIRCIRKRKYINSPETDVFDKSRALYGIDRAREGIRALNSVILVEGQFRSFDGNIRPGIRTLLPPLALRLPRSMPSF